MKIENDEFEMPTPCEHCGNIFDLNDGYGSEKWHKGITICQLCYELEEQEMGRDEEIEDLKNQISDAEITIKYAKERLAELEF
jgi:hypothetical protein